jgi:hypothetical protein
MEQISNLDDSQLHNLGKMVANAMIDLMIASKNKNFKEEFYITRLTEVEIEGEKNHWIQFQIAMQSNPLSFINDEIGIGYVPLTKKKEISLEIFESSLQILNLCEMNDIPIEIANLIINKFELAINKITNPKL